MLAASHHSAPASRIALYCVCFAATTFASCQRDPSSNAPATQPAPRAPADVTSQVVALNNRGVGLMGRFEYENARKAFDEARVLDSRNAELIVNLAIATLNRQREGDEDRALAMLDDALKLDPQALRATYNQGILRLYLQSPELAQPCFEKVVAADPQDAYAAYYLGQCLAQRKQYDQALEQYRRAIELDPLIRSAYYAASQANRALGRDDEAAKMLATFQELERNPQSHLAEFKYTRMGPKSMARVIDLPGAATIAPLKPEGPSFLSPEPLLTDGERFQWRAVAPDADRAISVTACDIDGDGDIDIFIADCLGQEDLFNAVCINDGTGKFTLDADHVLAKIPDVNAALWGDVDNDGLTDVYLCRKSPNMLWRQTAKNEWSDVTAVAGVSDGEFDSVDGALFDADHDGDLDIFVVNADGPNELFNNNLDGTFRPIASEAGIAGDGRGSRQVLPVDLDDDRDLDIVVINSKPPHEFWNNERGWRYSRASGLDELRSADIGSIMALDLTANGRMELVTADAQFPTVWSRASREDGSEWLPRRDSEVNFKLALSPADRFARPFGLADVTGEGAVEIAHTDDRGMLTISGFLGVHGPMTATLPPVAGWMFAVIDAALAPSLVMAQRDGQPMIRRPSSNAAPFITVAFTGRKVTSDNRQIRSNASGIGTRFAARIDSRWVAGDTLRNTSGPGQSLQPVAIGLGGEKQIDFLSIDWSDGVFQTELDLQPGQLHRIEETQRQLSSCPVLFAWDGEQYRFITDLLGVGGIGYMTAPNEYAPSRPWENLLLPANALQPRGEQYVLKLGEPMEEACYLDAARLVAYDLPPGWDMTIDDRMNITGPEPTGHAMYHRRDTMRAPAHAIDALGSDVTASLRDVDLHAAPVGTIDERFIGRLRDEQVITVTFDAAKSEIEQARSHERLRGGRWTMLIDGWVEYPYSQTMFAAWQAKADYRAPTLEMKTAAGDWTIIYDQFGYPAGMPRQMALPLPAEFDLDSSQTIEMRIRTNQEVYFDRIALVEVEECTDAVKTQLAMSAAALADVGFPRRSSGPQRQPSYDYDERAPLWDTRHQRGLYTEFGRVDELVAREDDALAIFGPGEEIELRFDAANLPPLPHGWTRRFVLEARGWCKDRDLYTADGETLEPLPNAKPPRDHAGRSAMHERFNTRYESGR